MLSSAAKHHINYQAYPEHGLVRYCFSDPNKSKTALNSYVAHVPQSLNAMTLNRAYMKVFYEIALNPNYSRNFKLLAQIHDSVLYEFRNEQVPTAAGLDSIPELVERCIQVPVTLKGYDGITRTFTVPADSKLGKDGLGAARWSETE
jgi:hypothetical protein